MVLGGRVSHLGIAVVDSVKQFPKSVITGRARAPGVGGFGMEDNRIYDRKALARFQKNKPFRSILGPIEGIVFDFWRAVTRTGNVQMGKWQHD